MKHAQSLAIAFILAWSNLFNFAPQAKNVKFEPDTERNTLAAHFNSVWGYLGKAIDAQEK